MPELIRPDGAVIHYEVFGSGYPFLLLAPGGVNSQIEFWEHSAVNAITEFSDEFMVIGMDQRTGSLAIGEMLKEGQLVQFHLRDADTSSGDLHAVLSRYAEENRENDIPGALLFSCLGRGEYLYGKPNHDTDLFRDKLGKVPIGGFFCNGEIGPVSGTTFLHGYTSSFGLFRPKF